MSPFIFQIRQKLTDFHNYWYSCLWVYLLSQSCNVSCLTWTVSVHYLVKLESRILSVPCPSKKCHIISSVKLSRFWLNLLYSSLNKFATKNIYKRFLPHLKSVYTTLWKIIRVTFFMDSSVVLWTAIACCCRDLRARLEVAIEHVLELVQQVERQKLAASPSRERLSSSGDEVQ